MEVPQVYQGADSWSDYVVLKLMHQEWQRPIDTSEFDSSFPQDKRPSPRVIIVILYWSLFEGLMDRLFEMAMREFPSSVSRDLLQRYSSIGSRLDRLYRIIFDTTFESDLSAIGYSHLYPHITEVQNKRNEFVHGNPEAINDGLIESILCHYHDLTDAWIRLFNLRCAKKVEANANQPLRTSSSPEKT